MKKYSVGLANRDCLFDQADGFESAEALIDWMMGRGGRYIAHIASDDLDAMPLKVEVIDDDLYCDGIGEYCTSERLADYIRKCL